jgi:SAM-dependent methyltransferase
LQLFLSFFLEVEVHLIHRQTCRVCGSPALTKVIDLGEQYIQSAFVKEGMPAPSSRKIPMALVRCDPMRDERACGLLQNEYTVPPEMMYASYWYRSGTNNTMREHLDNLVAEAIKLLGRTPWAVLDIGCNDGTLLAAYPWSVKKYGIDPSNATTDISTDAATVWRESFPSPKVLAHLHNSVDIVTSIAVNYDLEDPVEFARGVKMVLAPRGIWCFEMFYLPTMLERLGYDAVCHEHIEYYSLAVVERILRTTGLKLVSAQLNNINGGSIRCYAAHVNNDNVVATEDLRVLRQHEFDLKLDTNEPYLQFQERIEKHKAELHAFLLQLRAEGKRVHVYGASTKGNTILQWCNIDSTLIEAAADRSPGKHGARTIGTDIPIISEEESREMKPDYYLVLPWSFKEEFLKREKEGTKFIFPLPTIEVCGA